MLFTFDPVVTLLTNFTMFLSQILTPGYYDFPYLSATLIAVGCLLAIFSTMVDKSSKVLFISGISLVMASSVVYKLESEKLYFYKSDEREYAELVEDYHWLLSQLAFKEFVSSINEHTHDSLRVVYYERMCQYEEAKKQRQLAKIHFEQRKHRMTIFNVLTIK